MIPITKRIRVFNGEAHYLADGYQSLKAELSLESGGAWETFSSGEQVAASTITNCFKVTLASGEIVFMKRYVYEVRNTFRLWMLPSKPITEIYGFAQLKKIGIPTIDVLAYGERRHLGSLRSSYIVTRGVPNSQSVEEFAKHELPALPKDAQRNALKIIRKKLVAQIKLAHKAHFFHHDLKLRNILMHKTDDGSYELTWIDCPRAHYTWILRRHAVLVDFAAMTRSGLVYFSTYDLFRFVRDYIGTSVKNHKAKKLARRIWAYVSKNLPQKFKVKKNENTIA